MSKPAKDRAYLAWLHEQPCLAAGHADSPCRWPRTAHHVRRLGGPRDDRRAVSLCAGHHLHDWGRDSIERGRERFERLFGLSLEAEIVRLNQEWKKQSERAA